MRSPAQSLKFLKLYSRSSRADESFMTLVQMTLTVVEVLVLVAEDEVPHSSSGDEVPHSSSGDGVQHSSSGDGVQHSSSGDEVRHENGVSWPCLQHLKPNPAQTNKHTVYT